MAFSAASIIKKRASSPIQAPERTKKRCGTQISGEKRPGVGTEEAKGKKTG